MNKKNGNMEFVSHLVEFSKNGALMGPFVLEALMAYAREVQKREIPTPDTGFISAAAWKACAEEVIAAIDLRYADSSTLRSEV